MAEKWIQGAIKRPGAFKAKAKAAGKGTQAYARSVLKEGSKASTRTKRQAALAQTLSKLRSGKAKFLVPLVLACALAHGARAANMTCPSGYLTAPTGQTTTGPSVNTLTARAAPALVFQLQGGGTSTTAQVEICCSPFTCGAAAVWAPIQGGSVTLSGGNMNAAVSVVAPTCMYRVNVTACTSCLVTVVYACSGAH